MSLRSMVWIASFATIFLFLPSLAGKTWQFLVYAPWPVKSWIVYFLIGAFLIGLARSRFRRRNRLRLEAAAPVSPLAIAKERLARGEISIDEFRALREELNS
jgi:uncharacterized membrane protein